MSIFDNFKEKLSKFKHKEVIFIVVIIVIIVVIVVSFNGKETTTTISYKDMSAKEELTYRITDAVNALSGDNESKIIVYWDTAISQESSVTLGSLFNDNNTLKQDYTKILGVAVVCENGNDAEVKVKISYMLSNVFGVDINRISVFGKK